MILRTQGGGGGPGGSWLCTYSVYCIHLSRIERFTCIHLKFRAVKVVLLVTGRN